MRTMLSWLCLMSLLMLMALLLLLRNPPCAANVLCWRQPRIRGSVHCWTATDDATESDDEGVVVAVAADATSCTHRRAFCRVPTVNAALLLLRDGDDDAVRNYW